MKISIETSFQYPLAPKINSTYVNGNTFHPTSVYLYFHGLVIRGINQLQDQPLGILHRSFPPVPRLRGAVVFFIRISCSQIQVLFWLSRKPPYIDSSTKPPPCPIIS